MICNIDTTNFFDAVFYNARHNSIIIMDTTGKIIQVNEGFTLAFGYELPDVENKNFEMLFTDNDKLRNKPQNELELVKKHRSANDENYLVHKNGTPIWVTGECVAVENAETQWLVKIIHNINAAKQLERFLEEAEEFIDSIFDYKQDTALLMLDMRMKVIKVNKVFLQIFDLQTLPLVGVNLGSLHPFWNDVKVKETIREILIKNKSLKDCLLEVTVDGFDYKFQIDSKMITDNSLSERRILIVVREAESWKQKAEN